jgi:hypothetical protein
MLKKVSKKLEVTRGKASKRWQHYRTEKKHILSLKRMPSDFKRGMVQELRTTTRLNISTDWEDYRGFKFATVHRSDIEDFAFTKQYQTPKSETVQKYYRAKRGFDESKLDRIVPKLLQKPNVRGLLVVLKIQDEETERIIHVSKFLNKGAIDRLKELDKTVYDDITDKLFFTGYTEYQLKSINIRVIYEKAKKV